MKKSRKKKILLIIFLSLFSLHLIFTQLVQNLFSIGWSYISKPDLNYVKEKQWGYDSGFKIGLGDFVEFDNTGFFGLHVFQFFAKESPRALVIRLNKHF